MRSRRLRLSAISSSTRSTYCQLVKVDVRRRKSNTPCLQCGPNECFEHPLHVPWHQPDDSISLQHLKLSAFSHTIRDFPYREAYRGFDQFHSPYPHLQSLPQIDILIGLPNFLL